MDSMSVRGCHSDLEVTPDLLREAQEVLSHELLNSRLSVAAWPAVPLHIQRRIIPMSPSMRIRVPNPAELRCSRSSIRRASAGEARLGDPNIGPGGICIVS